ncbi:MAG: flagellar filament capping protein FliD [Rhodocyclaceae bacterium]|nr:flagellar filament capping protein FliD [Rhodocyclaceae bacterium]MBX3668628.1 flagellar filament capping protein FliD [Rhodocyclaceae bacterium]
MATISSPGLGSGLDISGLVTQLMAVERQPLTALATKEAGVQAKISAYGAVKSAFSQLQSAASALQLTATFSGRRASVADPAVAGIAAGTSAVAASYSLEVTQLAQAQKLVSGGFASSTTTVGTGTLKIDFGSYSGGNFAANSSKTGLTLTIDSSNNTLAGIRDAINGAQGGVTASIVNDGSNSRLLLSSNDSGAQNALRVSVTDSDGNNTDLAGLSQLVYDASTGGTTRLTEQLAARDAQFKLDNLSITRASNTLTDVIDGVTVNLFKTNTGSPTTLTVSRDNSGTTSAVQAFVKAYNDTITTLKNLSAYDAGTKQAALLQGEGTMYSLQQNLSATATLKIGGSSTLSSIGITLQKDGTLQIDSSKLDQSITSGAAAALFRGSGSGNGLATSFIDVVTKTLGTNGILTSRTDGLSNQIKDIDRRRDAMNIRINAIEARYRAQFNAMDAAVSSMQKTSAFLTQQLDALANLTKTTTK